MTLRHRIRMYMLNRQADALMRKARRPLRDNETAIGNADFEPLPDFSVTPGAWVFVAFAIAVLFIANV